MRVPCIMAKANTPTTAKYKVHLGGTRHKYFDNLEGSGGAREFCNHVARTKNIFLSIEAHKPRGIKSMQKSREVLFLLAKSSGIKWDRSFGDASHGSYTVDRDLSTHELFYHPRGGGNPSHLGSFGSVKAARSHAETHSAKRSALQKSSQLPKAAHGQYSIDRKGPGVHDLIYQGTGKDYQVHLGKFGSVGAAVQHAQKHAAKRTEYLRNPCS